MNPTSPLPVSTETLLFFVLLQLIVIIFFARVGGEVATRFGQSRAVGEIVTGILLGPSLFGLAAPRGFQFMFGSTPPGPLTILSQIGLILLMFQIGLEFDFSHLRERSNRTAVLSIAVAGMVAPFALGFVFGLCTAPLLSPDARPMASALFVATAFSITALPILGRIMIEFDMTQSEVGVIAISAAAINDVMGWLMLTVVTALALAQFSPGVLVVRLALLAGYVVVFWFAVRPLLRRLLDRSRLSSIGLSPNVLGLILVAVFISAIATYEIGIFAIFGGFMMGVLLHDQPLFAALWKNNVGKFVTVFFLPIFFTYTGLRTNIGALNSVALWGWCILLIVLATFGKIGGCYWAARWSGRTRAESRIIGVMMNTRALMELIVINVGFDLHVISPNVFTMLVLMAITSTVATTPALRRWLPAIGIRIPERDHALE